MSPRIDGGQHTAGEPGGEQPAAWAAGGSLRLAAPGRGDLVGGYSI